MIEPATAVAAIKTEARARKYIHECEASVRRHEHMVRRETANVNNYKERIRLVREKFELNDE